MFSLSGLVKKMQKVVEKVRDKAREVRSGGKEDSEETSEVSGVEGPMMEEQIFNIKSSNQIMVMYYIQTESEDEQEDRNCPNAFLMQANKELNLKLIRQEFPWCQLPENCPKNMRFGVGMGQQILWLDVKDDDPIPMYRQEVIFVKLSEGI